MIYLRSKKYSHLPNINGYLCLRCHWLLFYFVSVQASHRREPIPLISLWVLLDFLPISSNKSLHYRELNLDKFNITLCRNHVWLDKNPTFPDRNSISHPQKWMAKLQDIYAPNRFQLYVHSHTQAKILQLSWTSGIS